MPLHTRVQTQTKPILLVSVLLAVLPWSSSFVIRQRSFDLYSYSRDTAFSLRARGNSKEERGTKLIEESVEFRLHPSISDIPAKQWDNCLNDDEHASPFMQHAWLQCLEESKCVSTANGWMPQHVSISIDGSDWCGFLPLYAKSHSMGEFIFDNDWADAANANGIDYYPKLLVAVPFTPVTGRRMLLKPEIRATYPKEKIAALRQMVATFLKQVACKNNLSSVHLNFLLEDEAEDIAGKFSQPAIYKAQAMSLQGTVKSFLNKLQFDEKDGFMRRTSLQYHWSNSNSMNSGLPYDDFDDYLSCFKSKRRIAIKRERARVQIEEGIRIDAIVGRDILKYEGLVDRMFQLYLSTVNKMFWGRQYLNVEFFHLLTKSDFLENLCFMCARRKSSGDRFRAVDVVAGTFNIVRNGVFYGRYWGSIEEVKNLHFETCYWASIEYCIDNGLRRMEPGAGGGDYKWARGFDPALIHSAHYVSHSGLRQAVSQFIDYETESNVELLKYLMERSVVGSGEKWEEQPS